jgi:tyrosine-protein phosphatase OCA6
MVEDSIFRGAFPITRNKSFLERLSLKTIISLTPNKPLVFSNKKTYHFRIQKPKESIKITLDEIYEICSILKNKENHPIYIHCMDGMQVTNVIIMCYRKIKQWDMDSIINEASRFSKDGDMSEEIGFVECINFDFDMQKKKEKEEVVVVVESSSLHSSYSRTIEGLDLEMGTEA